MLVTFRCCACPTIGTRPATTFQPHGTSSAPARSSPHNHVECAPAAAQRLPCAVVEVFRVLSGGDAGSRVDDCLHRPARRRGVWRIVSPVPARSPSGQSCLRRSIPSGLRRAPLPRPTSLLPPSRSGDWFMHCLIASAGPGLPLCGSPLPFFPKRPPS